MVSLIAVHRVMQISVRSGHFRFDEGRVAFATAFKEMSDGHRQVIGPSGSESRGARSQAAFNSRVMSSQIGPRGPKLHILGF